MRRNSDEDRRRLERGGGDLLRRYAMARRTGQPTFELMQELHRQNVREAFYSPSPSNAHDHLDGVERLARIKTLRDIFDAGAEYPDPDVMALLSPLERRLIVFARHADVGEHVRASTSRFGFERESERPIHHTDETDEFHGLEGLDKALALARNREREWGPMSLTHDRPWKSSRFYDRYFVENAIFLTREGYAWRYMHYAGEHRDRTHDPGVQNLSYRFTNPDLEIYPNRGGPSEWGIANPLAVSEDQARLWSAVAQFEELLGEQLRTQRENAATWNGGQPATWREVRSVLWTVAAEADGSLPMDYSPATVSVGAWRGLSRSQDSGPVGVVLGVRRSGTRVLALGFGIQQVGRRETRIRPDKPWPELAPFSRRPSAAMAWRLENWAKSEGPDKIALTISVAHAWLDETRDMHEYP